MQPTENCEYKMMNLNQTKKQVLLEWAIKNKTFDLPHFGNNSNGKEPVVSELDYDPPKGFPLNSQTKYLLQSLNLLPFKFENILYFEGPELLKKRNLNDEEMDLNLDSSSEEKSEKGEIEQEEMGDLQELAQKLKTCE